jgi:hypothetical protein
MEGAELKRPRFRKLRIAWSVLCGTTCLLLIVLWVRSRPESKDAQSEMEGIWWNSTNTVFQLNSYRETISIGLTIADEPVGGNDGWTYRRAQYLDLQPWTWEKFKWVFETRPWLTFHARAPTLILLLVSAYLVIVPWLRWRFSLRALLIAITLLSIFMGILAILI